MTDPGEARAYPYRARWTSIVFGGLFFAASAVVLGIVASANDAGLRVKGIVELSSESASIFYWVLSALSAGFVLLAALMLLSRLRSDRQILVAADWISVPAPGFSSRVVTVRYRDIDRVERKEVHGQRFLILRFDGGKATITASMLPTDDDFERIARMVDDFRSAQRWRSHSAAAPSAP